MRWTSCDEVPLSYPLSYMQPITHILVKHTNKQTPHKLDSSLYQTWIESFLRSVCSGILGKCPRVNRHLLTCLQEMSCNVIGEQKLTTKDEQRRNGCVVSMMSTGACSWTRSM